MLFNIHDNQALRPHALPLNWTGSRQSLLAISKLDKSDSRCVLSSLLSPSWNEIVRIEAHVVLFRWKQHSITHGKIASLIETKKGMLLGSLDMLLALLALHPTKIDQQVAVGQQIVAFGTSNENRVGLVIRRPHDFILKSAPISESAWLSSTLVLAAFPH